MKLRLRTAGVLGVAVALTAGLVVNLSVPASATTSPPYEPDTVNQLGTIAFYDASGSQVTSGSTTASPLALYAVASSDDPSGTDSSAALYGYLPQNGVVPGNWSGEQLSASTVFPVTGPSVPTSVSSLGSHRPVVTGQSGDLTIGDLAADFPNNATDAYAGLYQLRILTPSNTKWWAADIQVSGSTWTQVYPSATSTPTATTTTLSASPASPSAVGQQVTLTATVTSGAAGTVQFKDNGSALGSPVTVASDQAQLQTSALAAGNHSLTAEFTPTDATAWAASTSSPVSYDVVAGATGTTASLSVSPVSPSYVGQQVTLTATVTSGAAGTVQFKDNGSALGSPVTVASDQAQLQTSALAAGNHSLTAEFTPTDATAWAASTSSAVSYVVIGAPAWRPVLYGAHRVGMVDACLASFTNSPTVSYTWSINGAVVSGATAATYKLPETAYLKTVGCSVTATNPGGTQSASSLTTKVGVGPKLVVTSKPYLYGYHTAGKYEYVKHGSWSPAATSYTYQWYFGSTKITGATASYYRVPAGKVGQYLYCIVTAKRYGWTNGAYRVGVKIT